VFASPEGAGEMWKISSSVDWTFLFAVLSAVTMTVGNLLAVNQKNVKRLLAYSSIAHAGYMLMGFVLLTAVGLKAILFYLVVYLFMNLGAFYVVVLVANGSRSEDISDFSGLGSRAPVAAVSLAIFLFALTGIPPFSGFIGKVYLFAEVINRGVYWLALVAALNSVISLYYYARIVKVMFLEDPTQSGELPVAFVPRVMLGILVVPTLLLGIYWEPVIRVAEASVKILTN
ncbi:MAG TPA: proton-conducting transporter membrane subunit, partial [Candidatus Deferrimicrobiaceae bacterium]|nr:proton-conducting transporter membrane subunit [Candidatus Deferrimicrobiaceae bacterium]